MKYLLLILLFAQAVFSQSDSLILKYRIINSVPQNANVYLNDELVGNTPYRMSETNTVFPMNVKLKMKSYVDYTFILNQEDINKTVSLVPITPGVKQKLVTENKSIFFEKKRKVIPLVLSSIVTGGGAILSYYFKKLANDNYDEYLSNGDQSKLDKTRKYDVLSAISLGVFQAGFAGLIYYLLIDK